MASLGRVVPLGAAERLGVLGRVVRLGAAERLGAVDRVIRPGLIPLATRGRAVPPPAGRQAEGPTKAGMRRALA